MPTHMSETEQYFLGLHPSEEVHRATIWKFSEGVSRRVDAEEQHRILSGEPPDVEVEGLPGWTFSRLSLDPGRYFPRIARPSNHSLNKSPGFNPNTIRERPSIETSNGQLIALKEQIERIFRVVQPHPDTMGVFGHDIRNLLILASTEVEAHWKSVLLANGSEGRTTNDYVKLAAPMKLNEYAVSLPFYPWLEPVRPFLNWNINGSPTRDLSWYDAYNHVKHDREVNFTKATITNALNALCGCFVMMCAQFGELNYWARPELRSFFHLSQSPIWNPSDVYCWPVRGEEFTPLNYPF